VRKQIEGSQAIAQTIAACRPNVICAYPISPQTHIVEALDDLTRRGLIPACEYVNVESEFSAMSVAIGASATGARVYTATASQGLLFMVEAVYNASGLGLPIVMTVANRAIGSPINIWNDHSDSLSQRDSGWIQIYAPDNQAASDLHPIAYKLGEELSLPVMVCVDGFVLTHAMEPIDVPDVEQVQSFLPAFTPRQKLDYENPVSIGAMVGPEAFTEVRYEAHLRHLNVLEALPRISDEFEAAFGRRAAGRSDVDGMVTAHRTEDAETIVVAMGATLGTLEDLVDQMRLDGESVGALGITLYRPFPSEAIHRQLRNAKRVIVLERALAVGVGGIVTADVRSALRDLPLNLHTVVAGLGGRPIMTAALRAMVTSAAAGELPEFSFLDLDPRMVEQALAGKGVARS
jgi:pyruvate ferredoxin oxidoreductase alpha subunit